MVFLSERNYACRLITDGTLKGMLTVVLENQKLRITVLVDKGSDIWEFLYKPLDIDFMWRSPMQLRDIRYFVPSSATKWGAFFDYFEGGWQELLPSTGRSPKTEYKDANFGLHGETTTIPWKFRVLEDTPEKVSVAFWVRLYRTPFYLEKVLSIESDKSVLTINEKLLNEGFEEMDFSWGHHPTLGDAFLNENCVIDTCVGKVHVLGGLPFERPRFNNGDVFDWPNGISKHGEKIDISRIPARKNQSADMLYLSGMDEGWMAVTDQSRGVGFGLVWPIEIFRYLWIWQVCGGAFGYPFYGRNYNMAIEPMTSRPGSGIVEAVKNGSALKLGPREELQVQIKAIVYEGNQRVEKISSDGKVIWKSKGGNQNG